MRRQCANGPARKSCIQSGSITIFYSSGRTRLARQRIAGGATSKKEDSELHDDGSVLRPANSALDFRILPGSHRSSWNHLLDTDLREAPFRTSYSDADRTALIPALMGIAGMLINGWHSDRTAERHWHSAIPLVAAGSMFGLLTVFRHEVPLAIACLLMGSGFFYAFYPVFWSIPTAMLSESAAAATFGLINSIGQLGGFAVKLRDWVSQRSNALTCSQLRAHSAGLCCSGRPGP
jgi:hypothetical protein